MKKMSTSHLHRHCIVFQDSSKVPRNSPAITSLGFTHKKILYYSLLNRVAKLRLVHLPRTHLPITLCDSKAF